MDLNVMNGQAPLSVSFDASGSSDPDGNLLSYNRGFGGGSIGSGATTSHTYSATGTKTAIVTSGDGNGGTDNATVTISVTGGDDDCTYGTPIFTALPLRYFPESYLPNNLSI